MKPITWKISKENFLVAAEWASKKLNNSIDRPNMNSRALPEALDDKIMGDIATIAAVEYIRSLGLQAVAYDQIRTDGFKDPDPGWDIAIAKQGLNNWARSTKNPKLPPKDISLTVSIKSSRLVRDESVFQAIQIRDFKIFSLNHGDINKDLTSDIEAQIYYPLEKTKLRRCSLTQQDVDSCALDRSKCHIVSDHLNTWNRFDECILTSWNFSQNIALDSNRLNEKNRTWSSFGKLMWIAPLKNGHSFESLQQAIDNLVNKIK